MPNQRGFAHILLILVLLLGVAVFALFYFGFLKKETFFSQSPTQNNIEVAKRTIYQNGQPSQVLYEVSTHYSDGSLEVVTSSNDQELSRQLYLKNTIFSLSNGTLTEQNISNQKNQTKYLTLGENLVNFVKNTPDLSKSSTTLEGKNVTIYTINDKQTSSSGFIKQALAQGIDGSIVNVYVDNSTGSPVKVEQTDPTTNQVQQTISYSTMSTESNPNVYVVEDDGSIDDPTLGLRFDKTAQLFYKNNPDKVNKYDFIAIFPAFKPATEVNITNTFAGLHVLAQNSVRGICTQLQQSNLSDWVSNRLQGLHYFPYKDNNYEDWLQFPNESGRLLLEETAHQWLVSIGKLHNRPGPLPSGLNSGSLPDGFNQICLDSILPLRSDDDGHWSKGLQSLPGSLGAMRETRPWIDNGDGTYSYDLNVRDNPRRFHPFDLYLMGLMDPSEIKGDFLLLSNLDEGPDIVSPITGMVTKHANAQKVNIQDIINNAGEPRSPGVNDSQKGFNLAFEHWHVL